MVYLDGPSYEAICCSCNGHIFIDISTCVRFTLVADRWGLSLVCNAGNMKIVTNHSCQLLGKEPKTHYTLIS